MLGVENPERHMAALLGRALDIALEKKDPKKKLEHREARGKAKTKTRSGSPRPDEVSVSPTRYVASEVRERVLARAGHQCQYRARDGTRCRSRTGLQIEHTLPFAIHRSHDERFLRAYCAAHHRFEAERVYGAAFIQGKIAESHERAP